MRIAAALAVAVGCLACRRETVPAPIEPQTVETVAIPSDASTAEVDIKVPLVANAIARCDMPKKTFARNEPIVLELELNQVPEELRVAARVLRSDGRKVAQVSELAEGRTAITLTLRDSIPAGSYTLEGLWGGNIVCEHTIEIAR